jgi:uncharacterized protein
MIENYTIVDGHVHTFATDDIAGRIIEAFNILYEIDFNLPGTGSIKDVLGNMNKNGIDFTVMANFAPAKILHRNNLWALEVSKQNKSLIPLVSFHPEMDEKLIEVLEGYIKGGARGIKLHPMAQAFNPNHKDLKEVYCYCNDIGFPIQFHCGRVSNARLNQYSDLDTIMPIIEKYSKMPIILNHMADGSMEDVLRLAENFDNVYFDTSIVITGYPPIMRVNEPSWIDDSLVIDLINKIGSERVLFGSDYPWGSPGHDAQRLIKSNLSQIQKRQIMGENALKLYKILN